jgi:hypothetical protein
MLELAWQCGILLFFYWNCSDSVEFCNIHEKQQNTTVRTVLIEKQQNTTLSAHFQHPWKTTKYHTVRTVPIEKQGNTVLTVWYYVIFLLELSWQCGILLFFIDVGTGLTVWYFVVFLLELYWHCGIFFIFYWNCPDSVVFCYFSIRTFLTVWYFVVFHRCWNSPDTTKYHTVRPVPTSMKNNKIPHCQDSSNRKIT